MSGTASALRSSCRRPLLVAAGLLVALLVPSGCDDHIIGHGAPIGTSCLREPPLTWENTGAALVGRHCRPCHGEDVRGGQRAEAPPDVNLDTYEDILTWADRIQARAVDSETMPPAGGMQPVEREQLGEWLRCEVFPALGDFEPGPEEEGS